MNRLRNIGITLLAGALLLSGFTSSALALTDACTPISNQASLTYSVGGVAETTPVLSDDGLGNGATVFQVATKVDLTVAAENSPQTATGAGSTTNNVLTFSITNTGNDVQRYSLRLSAAATLYNSGTFTDEFDMGNVTVYVDDDSDLSNGFTGSAISTTADGTHLGYTPDVNGNNGVIYVHVVGDVPAGRVSGDNAIYALQAVTHQITGRNGGNNAAAASDGGETDESAETVNGCATAIVLADNASNGGNTFTGVSGDLTDTARNGDAYAIGVYIVATASLSMEKSFDVIWDPINLAASPQAIPGARVEYTMTITNNSGTVDSTDLALTDQIPANTDFYVGSISAPVGATIEYSYDGGSSYEATAPTAGTNGADPDVDYIKVSAFDLAKSSNVEVKFTVVIE